MAPELQLVTTTTLRVSLIALSLAAVRQAARSLGER